MSARSEGGGHTPGKWVVQDNAAHGIHIYGPGGPFGGGKHLARVSNSAGVDVRANATLIAAVPTMLEALEDVIAMVKAAKASRTNPNTTFVDTRDIEATAARVRSAIALATRGAA